MNLRQNQKGFTIVELLIVVVVIAILAAISIVAYTGITNRANRSAAMEAANSVKSVAVTFQGTNNSYPTTRTMFVNGHNGTVANAVAKMPSDITFNGTLATATSAPTDPKTVSVEILGATAGASASSPTGFKVWYWDYVAGAPNGDMIVGEGVQLTTRAFVPAT